MWWVNCLKDHKKLSICSLGFTPFAPSERSMTPSSSGSSRNWRLIMTGLQDAVQEYLKAPPASTLPQSSFASTSSIQLEEGLHRMSDIIAGCWTKPYQTRGLRIPRGAHGRILWQRLSLLSRSGKRRRMKQVTSCFITRSSLVYHQTLRTCWLERLPQRVL